MPNTGHFTAIVEKMATKRIMVIGDVMLDRFVRGNVARISPESPVPVLEAHQETMMPGGAGNVILNLVGLGVRTDICAIIGDDREGDLLRGLILSYNIDDSHLMERTHAPTTMKTRFLAGHQQLLRVDHELTTPIPAELEERILEQLRAMIPQQNALILSDYGKGCLTETVLEVAITLARHHNIPVFVDPKGADYSKYRGATIITPNRKELAEAARGLPVEEDDDIVAACTTLINACGITGIIATRSQDGMTIVSRKSVPQDDFERPDFERPMHLRTVALEVFDVSGAGDTVIATAAAAYCSGASLIDAASIANVAAGIVVGKVGTAAIRSKELIDMLQQSGSHIATTPAGDRAALDRSRMAQICDWDEALEEIQRWKARGLKVGFTNGCFDILHAGHVSYLNNARSNCDRLVLGLNTDASIRLLKGEGRPINDAASRATVTGALGAVDLVVFFGAESEKDDNTAMDIIKHLKPDYYFKGDNYTRDTLPEATIIESYGGEVRLLPLTEGIGTSLTIQKITAIKVA
ncbi:MAG: D-glycero-beta-D-manno-heptose-7-phosphate kinase [Pseudobdellovibrionaceae bacterium]